MPRNAPWFKEKAMLAEALESGQIFDEEQLAFLEEIDIPDGQAAQTTIPNTIAFQTEDLNAYDFDCDDVSSAKAVLMANLSNYGSDFMSEESKYMDKETVLEKKIKKLDNIVVRIKRLLDDLEVTAVKMIDYSQREVIENGNAPPITKAIEGVETTIPPTPAKEKAQRRSDGFKVADGYANNEGKEILEEHWKEVFYEWSVPVETPASSSLVSCDCISGYDWSDQAELGLTNFALMAYSFTCSKFEVSTDSINSSSCLENAKILEEQNEQLLKDLRTSKIVDKYKTGLGYNVVPPPYTGNFMPPKPNLSYFGLEDVRNKMLKVIPTASEEDSIGKTNRIEYLTKELENLKIEKEGLESKLSGFKSATKDLDNLIGSQRSDKIKEGLGYSVVPPPPAQVYSPPKKDMSWIGVPEFADDTITNYTRPSPSVESNPNNLQNSSSSASENGESTGGILSKPEIKFVRPTDTPTVVKTDKVETAKKSTVKYTELCRKPSKKSTVRGNQRNWNNLKSQQLVKTSEAKASADKPKVVRKKFGSPLIEDWISNNDDEAKSKPKNEKKILNLSFAKIEFVKSKKQVKSLRKTTIIQGTSLGCGPRCQETIGDTIAQTRVLYLENTKTTQALKIDSLKRTGRIIDDIDADEGITLVDETAENLGRFNDQEDAKILFDVADDLRGEEVFVSQEVPFKEVSVVDEVNAGSNATTTTTTVDDITLAKALMEIKSAKPKAEKVLIQEPEQGTTTTTLATTTAATTITAASARPKAKGLVIHEQEQAPTSTVSSQQPSQVMVHDKGKGKMVEPKLVKKLSKKDQLILDEELAFKLQAKEEEEEMLAREKA
nr:hypothetical protein [Tanacetum cinerariifolium]